jgi:hypothetical protein
MSFFVKMISSFQMVSSSFQVSENVEPGNPFSVSFFSILVILRDSEILDTGFRVSSVLPVSWFPQLSAGYPGGEIYGN